MYKHYNVQYLPDYASKYPCVIATACEGKLYFHGAYVEAHAQAALDELFNIGYENVVILYGIEA